MYLRSLFSVNMMVISIRQHRKRYDSRGMGSREYIGDTIDSNCLV